MAFGLCAGVQGLARPGSESSFIQAFIPSPVYAAEQAPKGQSLKGQAAKSTAAKNPDSPAIRGRLQATPKSRPVGDGGVPLNSVDSIVAVIDGEPITMSDLQSFVVSRREGLGEESHQASHDEILRRGSEAGKKALKEMIQDKMLAREAESSNISATAEEIATYIEEVRKQNNVDLRTFESILGSRGIGMEAYREQVRNDIVRSRLVSIKVRNKINVLDEDVDRFLKAGTSKVSGKSSFHLEQVLLKAPSEDPENLEVIRTKIEEIRANAADGYPLEDLDKENYSDLGQAQLADLRPELEKAARKLAPGDVSAPICYDAVCAVLRRVPEGEKADVETPMKSVSEAERASIKKQLYEEKFQEGLENYLEVELPQKYQVELKW